MSRSNQCELELNACLYERSTQRNPTVSERNAHLVGGQSIKCQEQLCQCYSPACFGGPNAASPSLQEDCSLEVTDRGEACGSTT